MIDMSVDLVIHHLVCFPDPCLETSVRLDQVIQSTAPSQEIFTYVSCKYLANSL